MENWSKRLLISMALPALTACTAHIIEDERVVEPVSALNTSCSEPYEMVRDCEYSSSTQGPTRKALINDVLFDFAGSADGRVLHLELTDKEEFVTNMKVVLLFGALDPVGADLERVYIEVEKTLKKNKIEILKVVPVIAPQYFVKTGNVGDIVGYFLELNGDGYSILENFSLEEPTFQQSEKNSEPAITIE